VGAELGRGPPQNVIQRSALSRDQVGELVDMATDLLCDNNGKVGAGAAFRWRMGRRCNYQLRHATERGATGLAGPR
jgi:hypothetical protein